VLLPLLLLMLLTLLTLLCTCEQLRHFMFGSMGNHFEATSPQWVTTQNSLSAGPQYTWHLASASALLPSLDTKSGQHSAFAQFSSTCMYYGAEIIDAMAAQGLEDVPVGLIQSAIGGSQIESWMSNETLRSCKNQSLTGGAVPQVHDDSLMIPPSRGVCVWIPEVDLICAVDPEVLQDRGRLYYGMTAPFANYSVRGWLWYQGENNVYGDMGNSADGTGYGCSLPAMVRSWRDVWAGESAERGLFGEEG